MRKAFAEGDGAPEEGLGGKGGAHKQSGEGESWYGA